jgi:exopolyphosphatase/pppGpp-phosphohydrolase
MAVTASSATSPADQLGLHLSECAVEPRPGARAEAVHHVVLARPRVEHWSETLAAEDSHAQLARPGMVEGPADVIVGALPILAAVTAVFDRESCLMSEDDRLLASLQTSD